MAKEKGDRSGRQGKRIKEENGAGDEIRTHDIHLGKVALYH